MYFDGLAIKQFRLINEIARAELARLSGVPERRLYAIEYGAAARPEELRRIWWVLASCNSGDGPVPFSETMATELR
jgi:hypothetical protein